MNKEMLDKILSKYGSPIYVFNINKVRDRIKYLRERLPSNILLCYAIKANSFILKDIEKYIDRLEVCSYGEYQICRDLDIESKKILISGVNKQKEDIEDMIFGNKKLRYFTVESLEQFEMLKNISNKEKLNIMIRITSGNQFGINAEDAEKIIANHSNYENLNIKGIEYFSGTQKVSIKNLQREVDYIDNFIQNIEEKYNFDIEELEFGPGFPVYYFKNSDFNEEEFLKGFSEIIGNIKFKGKVILELGRSIAASCGNYITRVVDKKTNKNQNYAILDGGMHQLVYYGQSMAMKIPKCEVYPKRAEESEEKWNLCGSLCTINDILVKQFLISNLQIGDTFVFENTGAYCMMEGIALFLSRKLPKVVKIKEDGEIELVRQDLETYKFNM